MLRKLGILVFLVGVVVGGVIISPVGQIYLGVRKAKREIAKKIVQLSEPANYEPSGVALARLCQSEKSFYRGSTFEPVWAPAEIRAMKPSWILMDPDWAHVEFGGGFHHFGYRLDRDKEASDVAGSLNSHWTMTLHNDMGRDKVLYKFTLAKSERLEKKPVAASTAPSGR
jgi:hypothetical protein